METRETLRTIGAGMTRGVKSVWSFDPRRSMRERRLDAPSHPGSPRYMESQAMTVHWHPSLQSALLTPAHLPSARCRPELCSLETRLFAFHYTVT
jgi:hypothetical protein